MKTCNNSGNCRVEYSCVLPAQITTTGGFDPDLPAQDRVARIIDLNGNQTEAKICVALAPGVNPDETTEVTWASELDGGL
jgi:hydroxymethylglutaryl-CoA reductase